MQNSAITDQAVSVRDSSLELLRIISILMIIACHFAQYGGFTFPHENITVNRLWQQLLFLIGQRGNDMFILISGYFLINSRGIKFGKVIRILSEVIFYTVIISALAAISGLQDFSPISIFRTSGFHKASGFNWWFVRTYLALYLIHPYLNTFLHRLSREEYKQFLKAVFIYWSIIPMVTSSPFAGSQLVDFVCVYSVGAYVRIWAKDFSGGKRFILYGILFILADGLVLLSLDIAGMKYAIFAENATYFCGMMMPLTFLSALCIFMGFLRLNIPHSRVINTIAGTTLGVYMLHENIFSQHFLWNVIFRPASFQESTYFILYTLAVILAVLTVCSLLELLRSRLFRTLSMHIFTKRS